MLGETEVMASMLPLGLGGVLALLKRILARIVKSRFGKLFYVAFFLVVHLMKLHSLSLIWGVTSEAMEYEEQAEKRERERLRQEQAGSGARRGAHSLGSMHIGGGSDGDHAVAMSGKRGHEPPKDRNQLGNMRVIRRNLVYAVGLAPSLGSEDTLRKPEFFGQYGKISKIVINRNHPGNTGDPKRSTASAYITFVHPVRSDMYYVV
mgnify:CR=1 FL=1